MNILKSSIVRNFNIKQELVLYKRLEIDQLQKLTLLRVICQMGTQSLTELLDLGFAQTFMKIVFKFKRFYKTIKHYSILTNIYKKSSFLNLSMLSLDEVNLC